MNAILLLLPPIINIVVTGLFTGVVLRQYIRRRRNYQLYWSLALGMAFIATLSYMGMLLARPTSSQGIILFRLYYAFGGTIMPAWLGLGSIALLGKQRLTRICFGFLLLLSFIAFTFVMDAHINMDKLSMIAGTPGTGTLAPGPWLVMTIMLNTAGIVAVAGIALYSGWKIFRRQASVGGMKTLNLLWANVLIFVGSMLDAAAGTLARLLGLESTFWLIMAVGWVILFLGVLQTGRRAKTTVAQSMPEKQAIHR